MQQRKEETKWRRKGSRGGLGGAEPGQRAQLLPVGWIGPQEFMGCHCHLPAAGWAGAACPAPGQGAQRAGGHRLGAGVPRRLWSTGGCLLGGCSEEVDGWDGVQG